MDSLTTMTEELFKNWSTAEMEAAFGAALQNAVSTPDSKAGEAFWERTGEVDSPDGPRYARRQEPTTYDTLAHMDFDVDKDYREIKGILASQRAGCSDVIEAFRKKIGTVSANARSILCNSNEERALKEAFLERCTTISEEFSDWKGTSNPGPTIPLFNTPPKEYNNVAMAPDLSQKDPLVLLAAFIVVALSVYGSVVRDWANAALQLQLELLKLAYSQLRPQGPSAHDQDNIDAFPRDIRTARGVFQLEPVTITYASCPGCSTLYQAKNGLELPWKCTARRFQNSAPCDRTISKIAVKNSKKGVVERVPIQPYVLQDFDSFKASLLNRPGMEALLERGAAFNTAEDLWDIKDGTTIQELKGSDGKPFLDANQSELRLVWALSIDWFNPLLNKQAGRTLSIGSIVMTCLNLPPSLRYKAENIYLVGILPKEPSVDEINNYLDPVVEFLDQSWNHGTKFSKTESSPSGRVERSILAVVVSDLPASRKVTGAASYASIQYFCSLCRLPKDQINNFIVESWPTLSTRERRKAAQQWRDAPSAAARKRLFKQTGIRWSSLWKLEYFDPTKMVIVDAMHNLFLGLVQYHVREVLGIDSPRPESTMPAILSDEEKSGAEEALLKGRKLTRFTIPILEHLCEKAGLHVDYSGKKAKKPYLVTILEDYQRTVQDNNIQASHSFDTATHEIIEGLELVGDAYIDECQATQPAEIFIDAVTKMELNKIRHNIGSVVRPQYRQGPPSNLGDPTHGKLKASQWKCAIEFDLPVSIAMHWSQEMLPLNDKNRARRDKVFTSIMNLAMAIRWGTSYRTSKIHAEKFRHYMQSYLQDLLELYPNIRLRPNHHSALHIANNLIQFGPVHGWWMFPFERVIGRLQKINTNYKIGEMETTMLKSFCAGANLKALVEGDQCPPALQPAASILKDLMGHIQPESESFDRSSLSGNPRKTADGVDVKIGNLEAGNAFQEAFASYAITLLPPRYGILKIKKHTHLINGGVTFATATASRRDAEITFCPPRESNWVPGVIDSILSAEFQKTEVFVLGVRRRKSLDPTLQIANPFLRFPGFGATLWSPELEQSISYISLTKPIYHTQSMPWVNHSIVVKEIKPDL